MTVSLSHLIELYGPEVIPAAKRGVRGRIALARADLQSIERFNEAMDVTINKADFKKQPALNKWRMEYIESHTERAEKEIVIALYDLDFLNSFDKDGFRPESYTPTNGITDEDIARAKETDIRTMVKVFRGKTTCLWHDDKHPSMHIYKDNHGYCFSCNKYASAIDFYMVQYGCDFKTAVKKMV